MNKYVKWGGIGTVALAGLGGGAYGCNKLLDGSTEEGVQVAPPPAQPDAGTEEEITEDEASNTVRKAISEEVTAQLTNLKATINKTIDAKCNDPTSTIATKKGLGFAAEWNPSTITGGVNYVTAPCYDPYKKYTPGEPGVAYDGEYLYIKAHNIKGVNYWRCPDTTKLALKEDDVGSAFTGTPFAQATGLTIDRFGNPINPNSTITLCSEYNGPIPACAVTKKKTPTSCEQPKPKQECKSKNACDVPAAPQPKKSTKKSSRRSSGSSSVSRQALREARRAQRTADNALAEADRAHSRIDSARSNIERIERVTNGRVIRLYAPGRHLERYVAEACNEDPNSTACRNPRAE